MGVSEMAERDGVAEWDGVVSVSTLTDYEWRVT